MKFLILGTMKDSLADLQPDLRRKLLEASANWMYRHKMSNIVAEIYTLAGSNRIMAVCNHETIEDMVKTINTLPLSAYMNMETYPLANIDESMNALIENARVAEKIFAGAPK